MTSTTETEAAGRLRRIRADESVLMTIYGTAVESAQARHYNNDVNEFVDAYLRETDPRLVDEAFAKSVAVKTRQLPHRELVIWDITDSLSISRHYQGSAYYLNRNGRLLIQDPTIGQFHKACALFGITLTPTGAEA